MHVIPPATSSTLQHAGGSAPTLLSCGVLIGLVSNNQAEQLSRVLPHVIVLVVDVDPLTYDEDLDNPLNSFLHGKSGPIDGVEDRLDAVIAGPDDLAAIGPLSPIGDSWPAGHPLSVREIEVVALVGKGKSNRQIASDLTVSEAPSPPMCATSLKRPAPPIGPKRQPGRSVTGWSSPCHSRAYGVDVVEA